MAYDAPHLVLIGAAQHLVLGDKLSSDPINPCVTDFPDPDSRQLEAW